MAKAQQFKESDYDLVLDAFVPGKEVVGRNGQTERRGGNQNTWFHPAGMSLDGEVRAEWLHSDRAPGAILQIGGVIPGHRMLVDTKARVVKIIDRLSLPEHSSLVQQLKAIGQTERYWHARFDSFRKDVDFKPTDEEWPKWLYCMRRAVDHGTLRLVRGSLPTIDECRAMGQMVFNSAHITPKHGVAPFNILQPQKPEPATAGAKS